MHVYIERWWGEYIGGTDDTYSLMDYLTERGFQQDRPVEIELTTIMQDFRLTMARGIEDIRQTIDVYYTFEEGFHADIGCAVNLLMDVTAILVECQKNGQVCLMELVGTNQKEAVIIVKAGQEALLLLKNRMEDFIQHPLKYDLADFCPEDEMHTIAEQCKEMITELSIGSRRGEV